MYIPIKINTQDIFSQYDVSTPQVEEIINYVIKELTAKFAVRWEEQAKLELKTMRTRYVSSLKVIDQGRMQGAVVLDYTDIVVKMIEEGHEPFDEKLGFEKSSKKHIKKNGGWWLTIPFRVGTPGALDETVGFSSIMTEELYEIAKQKTGKEQTKENELPDNLKIHKTRAFLAATPKSKAFEAYEHKSSIFVGVSKSTDLTTGQNSYKSFRRVSDLSDDLSWIHPGMKEHNLAQKSWDRFETTLGIELPRIMDSALNSIGIF